MSPALSEPSDLTCPLCRSKLLSTTNAGITVEWCDTCHGTFLDADEPDKIMASRRKLRGRNRKETARAAIAVAVEFAAEVAFGGLFGNGPGR